MVPISDNIMNAQALPAFRRPFANLTLASLPALCAAVALAGCSGDETGLPSATGAGGAATGGVGFIPSGGTKTGGFGAATGGFGAATGGFGAATGGFGTATGGFGTATGGFGTATGGFGGTSASTAGGTSNTGGSSDGLTSGTPGAGGQLPADSSCVAGIATGDSCNPAVDSALCELLRQDCSCEASGLWTCDPNSGGSGGTSGSAGASGTGGDSVGGAGGIASETGGGPQEYAPENASADCEVSALPDAGQLPQIAAFPDPFTKLDGTRMTQKSEWRCRRQEIRKQAEAYIYGEKPTPDGVTGTVVDNRVTVHVQDEGKEIDFSADIVLPSTGQRPFPAIINVGSKMGGMGITLGESRILEQGVAIIYYNHYGLGIEGTPEASRGQPNTGLFYDIYGGNHSAGLLMAWAWGASRIIDVLQQSGGDIIDSTGLGVTGCSRNGKGAFAIGVFDDRIALTIPQETSTAGVPSYRIADRLGQERTDHNYYGLNWLSNSFAPFVFNNNTSNAVKLPIDTHSLVAMIAPRGLLVLENPHQTQMGAPAGHAATVAGAEVYDALGVQKNVSYHSNVSEQNHCSYKNEYTTLLTQSMASFLKHEGEAPGTFEVGANGSLNVSEWITWDTPTLAE